MSGKKQVCQEQKENFCVNVVEIVGKERHICRKRCERQETDSSRGKEKLCINVVEIREQKKRVSVGKPVYIVHLLVVKKSQCSIQMA